MYVYVVTLSSPLLSRLVPIGTFAGSVEGLKLAQAAALGHNADRHHWERCSELETLEDVVVAYRATAKFYLGTDILIKTVKVIAWWTMQDPTVESRD